MKLEIHYSGEWAALYKDGVLVPNTVGDSYLAEEAAFDLLGVKAVHQSNFLLGGERRRDAATSLTEIDEYNGGIDERRLEAEALRRQADQLLAEADAIEEGRV